MATTYTLISSNTLSSSAASVTFSSIPATYTDLVLKVSVRGDAAVVSNNLYCRFNGDTGANYSYTQLYGNGATAASANGSPTNPSIYQGNVGASATASTFSNVEIYIPSYTATQKKPFSADSAHETNATTAYRSANALLWQTTSAITSIDITIAGGSSFVSGSSFYLYGISKN